MSQPNDHDYIGMSNLEPGQYSKSEDWLKGEYDKLLIKVASLKSELAKARSLLKRNLERMELINGTAPVHCLYWEQGICPNHLLMMETASELERGAKGEGA